MWIINTPLHFKEHSSSAEFNSDSGDQEAPHLLIEHTFLQCSQNTPPVNGEKNHTHIPVPVALKSILIYMQSNKIHKVF